MMEPGEEQFDFGDDDFGRVEQNNIFQTDQTVGATWGDDDECDDLYNDLNVSFIQAPVTAYQSTKQESVGNGSAHKKVQYGDEQATGIISGEGRIGEAFAGSVGYIKHDEINKVEQGAISGNITEFSTGSRPKRDRMDFDEVEQQRGVVKKELRFGHPGPSSTTSFTSNVNKAPKNCTLYEDDESYMQLAARGTNQYDQTEEGDKLAVVPEQWTSFPGSRLAASPYKGSQAGAEAVESNMEVPEVLQAHARNVTTSFRESAASGKTGGLNVGGGSVKSGNNFDASSGKGSTSSPAGSSSNRVARAKSPAISSSNRVARAKSPAISSSNRVARAKSPAASTSNRVGRATSPAASTSNRRGPASTECTGQQDNSFLHSGVEGTTLFVGNLHWWTTDAELEIALSEYGKVKDMKFFEEKASGKSKGCCQVEFYDHTAVYKCKAVMHGQLFNGRPCVISFSPPVTLGQSRSAQVNKTYTQDQQPSETQTQQKPRRRLNDAGGGFYQSGEGRGNYGNMESGRSGYAQDMAGRGWGCQGRGRNMGWKNTGRGEGMASVGGRCGQGLQGLPGGTPIGKMAPHGMMAQGFNPLFSSHMARGAGIYGGYSHGNPYPGMIAAFPAVGAGIPGFAPHVNPSFLIQGLTTNGIGRLPTGVMEGNHSTMQIDGSVGRWVREDQNRQMTDYEEDAELDNGYGDVKHERGRSTDKRHRESIYEEDARLDHGYGNVKHERGRSTGKGDRESVFEEDARLDHGCGDVKHERGRSTGKRDRESYEDDARLDHGYGDVKHERGRSTGKSYRESVYEEDARLDHGYGDVKHERSRPDSKRGRESIYEEDVRLDHEYGVVKYERGRSTGRRDKESTYEEDARSDLGYGEVKYYGYGVVKYERGRSTGRKDKESTYEEDARSDRGYGEVKHERGRSGATNNQWVGAPERIFLGDREVEWNRDRYRDGRDTSKYQSGRDQSWEKEKILTHQNNQWSQSKEMNYAKRRRLSSGRK